MLKQRLVEVYCEKRSLTVKTGASRDIGAREWRAYP